jgi:hypothetical protein
MFIVVGLGLVQQAHYKSVTYRGALVGFVYPPFGGIFNLILPIKGEEVVVDKNLSVSIPFPFVPVSPFCRDVLFL